jgi:hypothetical protein
MSIKIICLTPIKNEAWILKEFLETTSLWADYIIIADQNSDDKSLEIIRMFPKVILIRNESVSYNESERQKMLIDAARKIDGDKILIALDADEALTSNSINNEEWNTIKNLKPGTVIKFDWVNLLPQKNIYWTGLNKMPFGFIDDGSDHSGQIIHSSRIPINQNSPVYNAKDIKVMHFQYANWDRMESKHRWYQCWEHINNPKRSILAIYRQYHHMYSIKKSKFKLIPKEWLALYGSKGIDYSNLKSEEFYYWDYEIIKLFDQYGLSFFSKIDIWDFDWATFYKENKIIKPLLFVDPRTKIDTYILKYFKYTQYYSNLLVVKIIDKFLKIFFKL